MAKAKQYTTLPTLSELAAQALRSKRNEASWQELLTATRTILNAGDFDTRELVERLRKGTVTVEECQLAADLIAGKKRANKRPAEKRVYVKREFPRQFIYCWLRADQRPEDIVKAVQEWLGKNGLSRTVVYQLIGEQKEALSKNSALSGG